MANKPGRYNRNRKKKKAEFHDMMHKVHVDSFDAKELMSDIQQTCITEEDIEHLWQMQNIWIVHNADLQQRYEQRRFSMRNMGRTEKETEDRLLFVAEGWMNAQRVCKFGVRCHEKKRDVLGDTHYGIHLNRNYDVLMRFMAFKNFQMAKFLVVVKVMLGRSKPVTAQMFGDYECIAPTPNFDCHLSDKRPDVENMYIGDALAHNFAYIYEYDEETIIPKQFPSQVVPVAVIQLSRTSNRLTKPSFYRPLFSGHHDVDPIDSVDSYTPVSRGRDRTSSGRVTQIYETDIEYGETSSEFCQPSVKYKPAHSKRFYSRRSRLQYYKNISRKARMRRKANARKAKRKSLNLSKRQNGSPLKEQKSQKCGKGDGATSQGLRKPTKSNLKENSAKKTEHFGKGVKHFFNTQLQKCGPLVNTTESYHDNASTTSDKSHQSNFVSSTNSVLDSASGTLQEKNHSANQDNVQSKLHTGAGNEIHEFDNDLNVTQNCNPKPVEKTKQKPPLILDIPSTNLQCQSATFPPTNEPDDEDSSTPTLDESYDASGNAFFPLNSIQSYGHQILPHFCIKKEPLSPDDISNDMSARHLDTLGRQNEDPPSFEEQKSVIGSANSSATTDIANPFNVSVRNQFAKNRSSVSPPPPPPPPPPKTKARPFRLIPIAGCKSSDKSIYHHSNELPIPTVPSAKSDEILDPRIRRYLGEDPKEKSGDDKCTNFNPLLTKIKQEPMDDDQYLRSACSSTQSNAVGSDSNSGVLEKQSGRDSKPEGLFDIQADVEKTLEELGEAIKMMQAQCLQGSESDNGIHQAPVTPSVELNSNFTNYLNALPAGENSKDKGATIESNESNEEKITQISTTQHQQSSGDTYEICPRNMGLSSYLPEYSDNSDYTRTARVLNQVFTKQNSHSPEKKEPMSMADYFGSSTREEKKISDKETRDKPSTKKTTSSTLSSNKRSSKERELKEDGKYVRKPESRDTVSYSRSRRESEIESKSKTIASLKDGRRDSRSRTRSINRDQSRHGHRDRDVPHYDRREERKRSHRSSSVEYKDNHTYPSEHRDSSVKKRRLHRTDDNSSHEQYASKHNRHELSGERVSSDRRRRSREETTSSGGRGVKDYSQDYRKFPRMSEIERFRNKHYGSVNDGRQDVRRRSSSNGFHYQSVTDKQRSQIKTERNESNPYFQKEVLDGTDASVTNTYTEKPSLLGDYTPPISCMFPQKQDNNKSVENCLSKAMTSLLKKVIFKDNDKESENSAEDRMADMVIEMMKQQLKTDISVTSEKQPKTSVENTAHPNLKQETYMNEYEGRYEHHTHPSSSWGGSSNYGQIGGQEFERPFPVSRYQNGPRYDQSREIYDDNWNNEWHRGGPPLRGGYANRSRPRGGAFLSHDSQYQNDDGYNQSSRAMSYHGYDGNQY